MWLWLIYLSYQSHLLTKSTWNWFVTELTMRQFFLYLLFHYFFFYVRRNSTKGNRKTIKEDPLKCRSWKGEIELAGRMSALIRSTITPVLFTRVCFQVILGYTLHLLPVSRLVTYSHQQVLSLRWILVCYSKLECLSCILYILNFYCDSPVSFNLTCTYMVKF